LIGSKDDDTFPWQTSIACSLCKSESAITDPESAEIVCSKCGMVISDKIEETIQEWHTLQSKNKKRTGMPTSLARHDMGLTIGRTDRDASGNKIEPYVHSTIICPYQIFQLIRNCLSSA
jgi:transcription initiation factor TFIIB